MAVKVIRGDHNSAHEVSEEACPKAVLHYGLKDIKIIVAYCIWQHVECLNHSEGVVFSFFSVVLQ